MDSRNGHQENSPQEVGSSEQLEDSTKEPISQPREDSNSDLPLPDSSSTESKKLFKHQTNDQNMSEK